jgi:hypothetical protein
MTHEEEDREFRWALDERRERAEEHEALTLRLDEAARRRRATPEGASGAAGNKEAP